MDDVARLAIEGHGAIQTDEATEQPLIVFLAGPIKHWWQPGMWDTPEHRRYVEWRDAVRAAVVKTGFCVTYSPHRAIQGTWHESLQTINDAAIRVCDVMLILGPYGIPADGTQREVALALHEQKPVWWFPPGHERVILALHQKLVDLYVSRQQTLTVETGQGTIVPC